jgi:tetratricopeptide (TPR) repeat protein
MEEAFFAIEFAPTYLPLHTYMAELLLKQEHLPEAVEKFAAIAKTYRARGEEQHAMRILQRLIKAAPMDLSARNQLISLHEQSGNYEKAIQEKISLAGVYYNLADLSRAREVYLDAFKIAEISRANRDLKVNILYHLADIEMQSLDWKHAEEIYAQIQTINPDDPRAIEKLIDIKLRLGHDDQAVQEIKQYVSFLEMTDKGSTGQQYLEKLVGEYSDRIPLRQVKAEFHQKNGQIEQAIEEFDAIGEILLESGDRQGAIEVIQEILSLNPANKGDYQELVKSLEAEE